MKNFFLVIPTRDRLEHLSNLLLDLNAFSSRISQVIIVDQSQISIQKEIEELSLLYSYVLVENERINSVNNSRNKALAFYKEEEWLFFLDDDLRISSIAFEQIIKTLEPNIIDVLVPGIQFEGMEDTEFKYNSVLDTIAKPHNFSKGRFRLQVCSGLNIVKRKVFKEAGFYFDENFTIWGDDWDYGMRLLQAGANIYYQPEILIEHLQAPSGGQRDKGKSLNVALEKQKLYFYFYRKHFSKTVLKHEMVLSFLISLKLLFTKGDFKNLRNNIIAIKKLKSM
jgi:GT2 family glycosyltransferase